MTFSRQNLLLPPPSSFGFTRIANFRTARSGATNYINVRECKLVYNSELVPTCTANPGSPVPWRSTSNAHETSL